MALVTGSGQGAGKVIALCLVKEGFAVASAALLQSSQRWQIPRLINTDKARTYGRALALLKHEGKCPPDVEH